MSDKRYDPMCLKLENYTPLYTFIVRYFLIEINSKIRCFNGYPKCSEKSDNTTWFKKRNWDMFHDTFRGAE